MFTSVQMGNTACYRVSFCIFPHSTHQGFSSCACLRIPSYNTDSKASIQTPKLTQWLSSCIWKEAFQWWANIFNFLPDVEKSQLHWKHVNHQISPKTENNLVRLLTVNIWTFRTHTHTHKHIHIWKFPILFLIF